MKKPEAIRNFVNINMDFLCSDEYNHKEYKRKKQRVFLDQYKVGGVKDKEIVDEFIKKVVSTKNFNSFTELDNFIIGNRFLKYLNVDSSGYKSTYDNKKKTKREMDNIKALKGVDQYEYIREKVVEESVDIIKSREEEIEKSIEEKKKELDSILDTMDYNEPMSFSDVDVEKEWWEILDLKTNPFPSTNGFASLDKSIFEEILVESRPFKWFSAKLVHGLKGVWNHGYLIAGALGTGKTTFYDYFKPRLILKDIEPIRITITEKSNVASYNKEFEGSLNRSLKRIKNKRPSARSDINESWDSSFYDTMIDLQSKTSVLGFVIHIEDLHKHSNNELVFDFLSHLQLYKNNFNEYEINVVFLVSGFPEWEKTIRSDGRLKSFFDGSQELNMPEVTPKLAATAIKKRLEVFSRSKDKKFPITKEFLQYVFDKERQENIIVNFRSYIDRALQHFSNGQFHILGLESEIIPSRTLKEIKEILESNEIFNKNMQSLMFKPKKMGYQTLQRAIDLLRHIYLQFTVNEKDDVFQDSSYLMLLKKLELSEFIIKSKMGKGIWRIHPSLIELNDKIKKEFNWSLEDYLSQIYGVYNEQKVAIKTLETNTKYHIKFDEIKHVFTKREIINLNQIIVDFTSHLLIDENLTVDITKKLTMNNIMSYVINLAKFILDFESPTFKDIQPDNMAQRWGLRFSTKENYIDFINKYHLVKEDVLLDSETKMRVVSLANKAFDELWQELFISANVHKMNGQITHNKFNNDYLTKITNIVEFKIGSSLKDPMFFILIDKYVKYFEYSYKEYLSLMTKILFGDKRFRYYPKSISITFADTKHEGSIQTYNEFGTLNRGSFGKIFSHNCENTNTVFKNIILPIIDNITISDLKVFNNLLNRFDQITSHNNTSSQSELRMDVGTFLELSSKLINKFVSTINVALFENSCVFKDQLKTNVVFGFKPRIKGPEGIIDFNSKINIPKEFEVYNITQYINEDISYFLDEFFENGKIEIDLCDIESVINTLPGSIYQNQLGVLKYLHVTNKIKIVPKYGNVIVCKKLNP